MNMCSMKAVHTLMQIAGAQGPFGDEKWLQNACSQMKMAQDSLRPMQMALRQLVTCEMVLDLL